MAEPFIGEIRMFAFQGQTPPRGWAACNGQLLQIAQNTALYSLFGVRYGGDGVRTFALPNLQGAVPIQPAAGHQVGEPGGEEKHTLTTAELPQHNHQAGLRRLISKHARITPALKHCMRAGFFNAILNYMRRLITSLCERE